MDKECRREKESDKTDETTKRLNEGAQTHHYLNLTQTKDQDQEQETKTRLDIKQTDENGKNRVGGN